MSELSVKIKNFKEQTSIIEKLFTDNFITQVISTIAKLITKEEEVYRNSIEKNERLQWSDLPDVKNSILQWKNYFNKKDVNINFEFEKFKKENQAGFLFEELIETKDKLEKDFSIANSYIDVIEKYVIGNIFKEEYFLIRFPQRKNWIENRLITKLYLDYLRDCINDEYPKLDNIEKEDFKQELIEVTDDFLYTYFID